ncbi:MAG: DegQ family serine endoprotease [Rhodospirillaceae bacterium]|nr:DegQ family serine endoprotease [Rhodospirillaceae bacterium]
MIGSGSQQTGIAAVTACATRWIGGAALAAGIALATPAQAGPAPDSFADLAEKLLPTVVNIATTQTVKNPERMPDMPQFPPGSPFDELFRDFFDRQGRMEGPVPRRATALGSGFLIDPSGLVVTNNHVVADADEISVILHDESAYKAKLVGRDSKLDLALLKLVDAPKNLPAIAFGDSDKMRVGDWVIAIGNRFGLGGSVSAGIISARARDIQAGPYDDFFQTDAAINKGNSGGPLINLNGEVIGINTAIFSPSGGSVGIGFSIPSNLVKPVLDDLRKYGKTQRGWLGVRIQTVTDDIAESLGLPKNMHGALVASVNPGGPADKAGIKPGDVITRFDGQDVGEMRRLPRIVATTAINKTAEIQIWRNGKTVSTKVVVGVLPESDEEATASTPEPETPKPEAGQVSIPGLGLALSPISPSLRDRYDIPADLKGVVVTDVTSGGAAAEKGLRPGDVVIEVSREAVASPADFAKRVEAARAAKRKSVLLLVQSEGLQKWVPLKVDAAPAKP